MQAKHSFSITSPRDVLAKLGRERDRFLEASANGSANHRFQYDHAINFCLTAWHLNDWIWRYLEGNGKDVMGITGCASYNEFHNSLRATSFELQICYEICTGSKHFVATKLEDEVVIGTGEVVRQDNGVSRSPSRSPAMSPSRSPVGGRYADIAVSVKGRGNIKFSVVCNGAWEFWNEYFRSHSL